MGAVLPLAIVGYYDDPAAGWLAMAAFFSVFWAIPYVFMFFFTHERVPICGEKSRFEIATFLRPFKIKAFRSLIIIYFTAYLAMDVMAAVFQYYMYYYLDRKSETDMVIGTMLVAQILMIPLVVMLANRYGKATVYKYSIIIWLLGALPLALYQPEWPEYSIYVISAIVGFGVTGCVVMPWSIFPDVTDVGELEFGYRIAGSFSGVMTFMRKFSGAIGIFCVGMMLELSGYLAPIKGMVDGKYTETLQTQPESVILALQSIVLFVPILLLVPAFIVAHKFPLDMHIHERLRKHLEYKRGETDHDNLTEDEVAEMKRLLV